VFALVVTVVGCPVVDISNDEVVIDCLKVFVSSVIDDVDRYV